VDATCLTVIIPPVLRAFTFNAARIWRREFSDVLRS
jgi:hypothetical protein